MHLGGHWGGREVGARFRFCSLACVAVQISVFALRIYYYFLAARRPGNSEPQHGDAHPGVVEKAVLGV